jgi:pyruvate dehydrogenase E2 component (dihydrolipoamide acetyltransferase)
VAFEDVLMPQMGESIAEGTLSRWLKKLGDPIKRDEPMFEISTDKVDAEIPAPVAGVISEILVTEGQTVPVGALVARIEVGATAGSTTAPAAAPSPAAAVPAAAPSAPPPAVAPAAPAVSTPAAATAASGNGASLEERLRTKSSPLVRKMAAEAGVPLDALTGSGIAGRVTKKDFEAFLASGASVPSAAPTPAAAPAAASARPAAAHAAPMPTPWAGDVVEPMSRIRQLTAEHMVLARQTSMHVTSFFEVDLTRVARIRAAKRAEFERTTGEKLTYLPFIISAVVAGLKKFPILNASVAGTDIIYRKSYNIGIAVALDWGLIVPVIKRADDLSMTGLTRSLNDLAGRARNKKLKPDEVQDASFTITNPGVFGSLMGTPIIPVPTTGILCLGAIEKRPKVITGADGEDTIAIRTCAYFSLSFDHRVVDGSDADKFLAFVKQQLETMTDPAL